MKMIDPIVYATPVFLILILVEIVISVRENESVYQAKDLLTSVYLSIGASLITTFTKIAMLALFIYLHESLSALRQQWLGYSSLPWTGWIWALAMLGDDFNFYWYHRFSHTIRVLWAAHVVHHSSGYFNLGSGIRNGWTTTFYKPLLWIWMPIVGFPPVMVATAMAINSIYQFFLHTKKVPPLGWLEEVFNTPQLHQVHHSCNRQYLDKNYGGILIIWDKLFGTFERCETVSTLQFGLPDGPASSNPFKVVCSEYIKIWRDVKKVSSRKQKVKYVLYPPGWSHDNSTKTAKQLQRNQL